MSTCVECGTVLTDEARFCPDCGTPRLGPAPSGQEPEADPAAPLACPACGSTMPDGAQFCGDCGTPLGSSQSAPGSSRASVALASARSAARQAQRSTHASGFLSRATPFDWIVIGAAPLALIGSFLAKYSWPDSSVNAWDSAWSGLAVLLCIVAAGIVAARLADPRASIPAVAILACGALAVLLMLIEFVRKPSGGDDYAASFGAGIFICTVAAIAVAVAGGLRWQQERVQHAAEARRARRERAGAHDASSYGGSPYDAARPSARELPARATSGSYPQRADERERSAGAPPGDFPARPAADDNPLSFYWGTPRRTTARHETAATDQPSAYVPRHARTTDVDEEPAPHRPPTPARDAYAGREPQPAPRHAAPADTPEQRAPYRPPAPASGRQAEQDPVAPTSSPVSAKQWTVPTFDPTVVLDYGVKGQFDPPPTPPPQPLKPLFCGNCGQKLTGRPFCKACGHRVDA